MWFYTFVISRIDFVNFRHASDFDEIADISYFNVLIRY